MATAEQIHAYHGECSAVSFDKFTAQGAYEYDPADSEYYSDVSEENGNVARVLAGVCVLCCLAMFIFSLVLCCVNHHWMDRWNFFRLVRSGQNRVKRFLGLFFMTTLVICALLVTAMSLWGIVKVQNDVSKVAPKAFDFLERSEKQLGAIDSNLTTAVNNGYKIIGAIRNAITQIRSDLPTGQLDEQETTAETAEAFSSMLTDLEKQTAEADDAFNAIEDEVNDNLDDLLKEMRDAIGHRDDGDSINGAVEVVLIAAYSLFIIMVVVSALASLCGASTCFLLFWASLMWVMLCISFIFVGLLDISKELSSQTCLYIDTFAVRELRKEISVDPQRTEDLLWYYFRPANDGDLSLTQLEDLWGFPLTNVVGYLDSVDEQIFNGTELSFPFSAGSKATRRALNNVRKRIPQARKDIAYVQDLIIGDTLHDLHSDFKDLICCTEMEALESIWQAWVVSSTFGLIIAVLMTIQGYMSLRFGKRPVIGMPVTRIETQKHSAYMAPPVVEESFMVSTTTDTVPRNEPTPPRQNQPHFGGALPQSTVADLSTKPAQHFY